MTKSLKERNSWKIWLVVVANCLIFWAVINVEYLRFKDIAATSRFITTLLPAGLGIIVATVLNSLLGSGFKDSLVFWRVRHALPGHRAFSVHAGRDPRIDAARLRAQIRKQPTTPKEENALWYKIYKTFDKEPSVSDAHIAFLLLRDYAALAFLFFLIFGPLGFFLIPSGRAPLIYAGFLAMQYILVAIAARNSGVRLVTNVLALKAAAKR